MICTADTALTERIGKALSGRGLQQRAADADSVLFQLNVAPPDAMLCDQFLPGHEGMALTQMIRRGPDLVDMPIIVMSDFESLRISSPARWRVRMIIWQSCSIPSCLPPARISAQAGVTVAGDAAAATIPTCAPQLYHALPPACLGWCCMICTDSRFWRSYRPSTVAGKRRENPGLGVSSGRAIGARANATRRACSGFPHDPRGCLTR